MRKIEDFLVAEWKILLKRAWSLRFGAVAAIMSGCEAVFPFYADAVSHRIFVGVLFFFVAGAFISRLVAQKKITEEVNQCKSHDQQ